MVENEILCEFQNNTQTYTKFINNIVNFKKSQQIVKQIVKEIVKWIAEWTVIDTLENVVPNFWLIQIILHFSNIYFSYYWLNRAISIDSIRCHSRYQDWLAFRNSTVQRDTDSYVKRC